MLWMITYWFVYLLLPGVMSLVEAAACLVSARHIANLPWSLPAASVLDILLGSIRVR